LTSTVNLFKKRIYVKISIAEQFKWLAFNRPISSARQKLKAEISSPGRAHFAQYAQAAPQDNCGQRQFMTACLSLKVHYRSIFGTAQSPLLVKVIT